MSIIHNGQSNNAEMAAAQFMGSASTTEDDHQHNGNRDNTDNDDDGDGPWLSKSRLTSTETDRESLDETIVEEDPEVQLDFYKFKVEQLKNRPDATVGEFKDMLRDRIKLILNRALPVGCFNDGLPPRVVDKMADVYKAICWALGEESDAEEQPLEGG